MYRIKLILCKIEDSVVFHSSGNDLTKQSPFQILRAIHFSVLLLVVTEPSTLFIKYLDWWWEIIRQNHKINRRKKSKNNQKRYKTTQCRMGILYSLIWGEMRLKSEKTVNDFLWCEFLNEGSRNFLFIYFSSLLSNFIQKDHISIK